MGTARARPQTEISRRSRRRPRRAGRPPRPQAARMAHRVCRTVASAAVRRLLACDAIAHAVGGDRAHPDDPHRREGAARDGHADDPESGSPHRCDPQQPRRRPAIQLALPFGRPLAHTLDATLDSVRDRFGRAAITPAVLLGRDRPIGPAAPRLSGRSRKATLTSTRWRRGHADRPTNDASGPIANAAGAEGLTLDGSTSPILRLAKRSSASTPRRSLVTNSTGPQTDCPRHPRTSSPAS